MYTMIESTNKQGGNMKKILNEIIYKWPFKAIFIVVIIIAISATGIVNVNLSTGNETLIEPTSSTYLDNSKYQSIFGTDPIIIVLEGDSQSDLLSYESLSLMNTLHSNLEDISGIFYVNSPITVIDYAGQLSVVKYQTALDEIASGLGMIATSIGQMSESQPDIDSEVLSTALNNIVSAQNNVTTGLQNEISLMSSMKINVDNEIALLTIQRDALDPIVDETEYQSITQTIMILSNVSNLYSQMTSLNTSFATATTQTSMGVDNILTQLTPMFATMASLETNLASLETNLSSMSQNVAMLAANFNGFTASFPTEESTLTNMVYPDGVNVNPMLASYVVDETHLYISIILEEGTSEAQIETILDEINASFDGSMYEDSLVSGKPVLNYDIKSSMTDSMKTMMMMSGVIMVIVLLLLFPVPFRLLPLFVVLIAVVTTIGVMGLTGIPLTMVSMAVFPVLIGLGIDYSIQFHNRYMEEIAGGIDHE